MLLFSYANYLYLEKPLKIFGTLLIGLVLVGFMVFNATFNNISAISRLSFLLVEETGVPGENH